MRSAVWTPARRLIRARYLLVSRESVLADFEIAVIREAHARVTRGLGGVSEAEQAVIDQALEAMLAAPPQALDVMLHGEVAA